MDWQFVENQILKYKKHHFCLGVTFPTDKASRQILPMIWELNYIEYACS
jgi:hypothetical protein